MALRRLVSRPPAGLADGERGAEGGPSSTSMCVDVMEAPQHWSLGDRSIANQVARCWTLEPEAAMLAVEVVVLRELGEDDAQIVAR